MMRSTYRFAAGFSFAVLLLGSGEVLSQGTTPTTTAVTVVAPQGSGNITPSATSVYTQPVAVTVAVTAGSGVVAPDGSVTVYWSLPGGSLNLGCSAPLAAPVGLTSTATCTLPTLTVPSSIGPDTYVISATYPGSAAFAFSISSGAGNGSLTVNYATATTTITSHVPDPSVVNAPVTVTTTVTPDPPSIGPLPMRGITVTDGSVSCDIPMPATSCDLIPITPGVKTLTARYSGEINMYAPSTSAGVSHTVTSGTFTGPTTRIGVNGTATITGGGPTCGFVDPAFVAVTPLTPPPGLVFPFGLFDFVLAGCAPGAAVDVQIVYTSPLPEGARYWKFGRTPDDGTPHWYPMPGATVSGTTVTFTLRDGQIGDDDLSANGTIVDSGGPAAQTVSTPVPTLHATLLAALALMLIGLTWLAIGSRSH